MHLTWSGLGLLMVGAGIAWFWHDSLQIRERANAAAMEACARLGLQFLDGTVAFARLRLTRDNGQMKLRRTYLFDYTAHSIDRLQGFVVLLGRQIEAVGFASDTTNKLRADITILPTLNTASNLIEAQLNTAPPPEAAAVAAKVPSNDEPPPVSAKVLNLDDWRRVRNDRP